MSKNSRMYKRPPHTPLTLALPIRSELLNLLLRAVFFQNHLLSVVSLHERVRMGGRAGWGLTQRRACLSGAGADSSSMDGISSGLHPIRSAAWPRRAALSAKNT